MMGFLFISIVSSVASGIGWWIGDFFGFVAAVILSSVMGIIGFYFGMKWNRELFSEY